jgi:radical SAM superfamily enzyme YgiQ (UPF0313 family)
MTSDQPDILALCCHIWNIKMVKGLLSEIKASLPHLKIILGGPEVSFNADEIMADYPEVDFIICGEGEVPFTELLLVLENEEYIDPSHTRYSQIAGLCYRQGDRILGNPASEPVGQPPSPYTDEYFAQLKGRIAYFESSRGCPFACTFCLSGRPGNVRFFDIEQAKIDILRLANSGSKTIKFVDRTFNCQARRTKEWITYILQQATDKSNPAIPSGVCFHFEVGADLFDQETITLLNQAPVGLFQLEAGLQSFNPQTLAAIQRHTNLDLLKQHVQQLLAPGNIHIHIDLIAGLPYEDFASFGRSFDAAYELAPHMLQLGFLKMLHGSRLRQQATELGYTYSEQPPYEFDSNPWLTLADKKQLKLCEDALERLYNSGRFPRTLDYVRKVTNLRPFQFYGDFGSYVGEVAGISLDQYTTLFYEFALGLEGVNRQRLRDVLVCDRLSCDNTGSLPRCLKVEDQRHKRVARGLAAKLVNKKQPYRLYGFALLYGGDELTVVVADYTKKDSVSGRYELEYFNAAAFATVLQN